MKNPELAEKIIEQMNDALIFADLAGNIQRWNRAATRIFGFTKEEALGESLNIIIPEKIRKAHWQGFERAVQSGNLQLSGNPTLTRALHKDDTQKIYVEMSFSLVVDTDGKVIGSIAVARDVTGKIGK